MILLGIKLKLKLKGKRCTFKKYDKMMHWETQAVSTLLASVNSISSQALPF
jgi:hypothetical protein